MKINLNPIKVIDTMKHQMDIMRGYHTEYSTTRRTVQDKQYEDRSLENLTNIDLIPSTGINIFAQEQ